MIYTLDEINIIAKKIVADLDSKIVILNGDMGVGKTTLVKQICKELGVNDVSNSPSFSLVNEYEIEQNRQPVYHFDFYRINDENEAYDIGFEDYLYSGNWCFIEWASKVENLLPTDIATITISLIDNNTREIVLS